MNKIELVATSSFGLEAVVAQEIRALGYKDVIVENAKVTFKSDLSAICKSNLWLRCADRVLLKMGEFPARTYEELFENTRELPWPEWLPENACFPVQGKSIKSTLFSVPDCQAIVKKAVVEKMKQRYRRQWFEEDGARYMIEVALLKDIATLTIDTSGAGLHKRGYRKLSAAAPLRETLAAAIVMLSNWKPGLILIDPFCGSGTIPIEAALIGHNIAPGLQREFAAEQWPAISTRMWKEARDEAESKIQRVSKLQLRGTDINGEALSLARYHSRMAGVEKSIHWQQIPIDDLRVSKKFGSIICNPPYGQRLEDEKSVERLYKLMGRVFTRLDTWSYYILTAHPRFEKFFGRISDRKRKLYNGRIRCYYYQYYGPRPPVRKPKEPLRS